MSVCHVQWALVIRQSIDQFNKPALANLNLLAGQKLLHTTFIEHKCQENKAIYIICELRRRPDYSLRYTMIPRSELGSASVIFTSTN